MRKNRCFKMIAWLLSVIMILNMMPIAALAEEPVADVAVSDPETEKINDSTGLSFITPDTPSPGGSSGGSSDGGSSSMSIQYIRTEDKAPVSMKEGDPDPNKEYYIEIKFDPGTAKIASIKDLYFPLDYVRITGDLPSEKGEYKCYYVIDPDNPNQHHLEFEWELDAKKTAFTVKIACTPAFPKVYEYDGAYAIVSNLTSGMMVSGQDTFADKTKRQVIKSASCTIMSDGKVRNNDFDDTTTYWTFTHVSGQWYTISNGGQNVKFNDKDGAVLTPDFVALRLEETKANQVIISDGYEKKFLTNCKENPAAGFGWYKDKKNQKMDLYTAADMTRKPTMEMTNGLAIVDESMEKVLTTSVNSNSLNIASYHLVSDGKVMVIEEGKTAATWEFENIKDETGKARSDWYYIKSGDQYLNLSNGIVTVSGTPTPIFVRHIEKSTKLFVLSDSPYTNTTYLSSYKHPNLVQYEDAIAKANDEYPSGTKHHLYEASDYKAGYKLSLLPVAADGEDYLYLTFNYNKGNVTPLTGEVDGRPLDEQNRIKVYANEEIELPKLETIGKQSAFVGWSTSPNFYKKEGATTYHDFYPAETPKYKMPANSTTLYAVYDTTTTKTLFSIRNGLETATIPPEPGNGDTEHGTDKYTHVEEYLTTKDILKNPVWVIDTKGTGNISSVTGGYLINSVTDNLKYIPDDTKIAAAIDGYDPETMYVHWYVIKYNGEDKTNGGGWHVDGVIRKRPTVNVTITGKTGTLVYNGQEQTVEGFDVSIDTPGTNLKTTDIKLADGKFAIAAGTDAYSETNPDGIYKMGLDASYFVNTNPQYYVEIKIADKGDGWLKITKRPVTLKANDASNEYTGSEVTYDKAANAEDPYYDFVDDPAIDNANEGLVTGHAITAITLSGSGKTVNKPNEYYPITIDQNSVKIGDGTNDFTANYDITVKEGKLTITQNSTAIKVEPASGSKTYDGKPLTKTAKEDFKVTVTGTLPTGFTWEATADGTVTNVTPGNNEKPVNAITSFIIYDENENDVTDQFSNIDTTATGTLEIIARPIHLTANNASNDYTGEEITYATASDAKKPYYTIEDKEGVEDGLAEGQSITAITLSGAGTDVKAEGYPITIDKDSVQIGTYTDNYDISVTPGTLTINAIGFTVAELKDVTYNGEAQAQEVTVTDSLKKTLVKDTDYEVSYSTDTTNAGTVTVTVTGKGNHTGTVRTTYEILKRKITVYDEDKRDFSGDDETLTIGADKATNVVTGETLTLDDATITGKAADTYETVSDYTWSVAKADGTDSTDNYSIEVTGKLVISPIGFTVADLGDVTYNGEAQAQEVTVTDSLGNTLVKDTDYEVSYSADTTNAGTVTVTVTGKGNYTGTATKTYEIQKRKITVYDEDTRDYNGGNQTLTLSADKAEGVATGETLTLTDATIRGKAADTHTNVSRYSWRVTKANGTDSTRNYTIEVTGKLVISPKAATVTAEAKSKIYGDADPALTAVVDGTVNNETINYTLERTAGENVGEYDIIVTLGQNSNYTVEKTDSKLNISPKAATVTAEAKSKTYGEDDPELTAVVAGNVNGDTINYTLERTAGENVGEYDITVTLGENSNYTVEKTDSKLTISPKAATVTAEAKSKTYGEDDPELTAVVAGNVNGETINYTLARTAGENVGEYDITVTLGENSNYTVEKTDSKLTISPKAATVTAEAKSKTYGDADPTLTAVVAGNVNGETINYTLARTAGENVGEYDITVTLGENSNYTVEKTDSELTINPKAATVTAEAKSKTYGEDDPELTAVVAGTVNGDTINYTLARTAGEDVGEYDITVTLGENSNYTVEKTDSKLTISPKAVTVTAEAKSKTYGEADPELTAVVEGNLEGETINYTLAREAGEDAGEYGITVTLGENSNYTVEKADSTLTIDKVEEVHVKITAHGGEATYDAQNHTITGYDVEIDNPLYTTDDFLFSGKDTLTARNAGTYNMGLSAADFTNLSNNFENVVFEVTNRNLVIAPKAATVTVQNKNKTYGDTDPMLTATVDGLAGTDAVIPTVSRAAGENAGSYAINATAADPNYTFTIVPGTLTISPKTLTVKADTKVKTFGEDEPGLTATIDGLANGDTADVISYTVERTGGEDAGTYTINVTGSEFQGNYNVVFESAEMTIVPEGTVVVRITAHNGEFKYDGKEHDLSGYDVAINNELYSEGAITFTGNSELKATNAGTYRTAMTAADFTNNDPNFENVVFEVTNGELVITKRQVTLTSGDAEKTYDGKALKSDDITIGGDGFAEGEGLIYNMTGSITNPGTAENTFTWFAAEGTLEANYDFTQTNGTLTMLPATTHTLTISYVTEGGRDVSTFRREYAVGEQYEVVTPAVEGFAADEETISGIMGNADINITVTYSPILYTLTIHYTAVGEDGEVAEPTVLHLAAGEGYGVPVAQIAGYEALLDMIKGIMPASDRSITVPMVGEEAAKILGGGRPTMIIEDERTALGIDNAVLGSGEIIE